MKGSAIAHVLNDTTHARLSAARGAIVERQEAMEQATLAALAISLLDALMEFDPIGIRLREGFYHTTKIFVKLSLCAVQDMLYSF